MIEINLDPNIVQIGSFIVAWHGVFTALGILGGVLLAARVMRMFGLSDDPVYNSALWAVPIAIVGARILHVIANWDQFADNPISVLFINEGGIAVWGAVIGGIIGGYLYVRRSGTPLGPYADAAALGLLLGMIIGRIGDIINGEHWGTETNVPWSVTYTHPETLGERGLSVHLAVGYEMIWNIAVLALLLWLVRRIRVRGVVFWLMLILYSVSRLWTHEFRKLPEVALGLQEAQLIALATILVSVPALLWVWRRGLNRQEPATAAPARIEESNPKPAG